MKNNRSVEVNALKMVIINDGALIERFFNKVQKSEKCWNWTGSKWSSGYGIFCYLKRIKAHRFSYILHFKKLIPIGKFVCHSCDNKSCVNPDHLWIGTNQENQIDASKKGKSISPTGKYCASEILEIRKILKFGGYKERDIARLYKMSFSNINSIKNRVIWKYV